MVTQALQRRHPGFNESYYGFKFFDRLLEEARDRRLVDLESDEKSGGYILTATLSEDWAAARQSGSLVSSGSSGGAP